MGGDGSKGSKRKPARRSAYAEQPMVVMLTREQKTAISELHGVMPPRLTVSDVVRALLDMAIPAAKDRPASLIETFTAHLAAETKSA